MKKIAEFREGCKFYVLLAMQKKKKKKKKYYGNISVIPPSDLHHFLAASLCGIHSEATEKIFTQLDWKMSS